MTSTLITGTTRLWHTWTKGERRDAAEAIRIGGLVPIEDFELRNNASGTSRGSFRRSSKAKRQQKALTLAVSPLDNNASETCPTPASHIRHGTSLRAVSSVSNIAQVLAEGPWSPPLTARHYSFQATGLLDKPLPGRPRSYTAPLAPHLSPDLAELPGSFPVNFVDYPHSSKIPVEESVERFLREDVDEPEGHPQARPTHMYTGSQKDPTRTDNDNLTLSPGQNFLPSPLTPQTHFGMVLRPITGRVSSNESNRPNLSLVHDVSPLPSPQIVQQPASRQRNHLGVLDNEAQGSTCADLKDVEQLRVVIGTRDKQISKLSAQFDCLRNSHEAHLSSLTVTHSKELHDLGVYTDALQKQTSLASDGSQGVSNAVSTTWHLLNDDQSPGGHSLKSMQSFQSALELHRKMAQEYAEQNESLKAQLEAADKRVLEAESVRIERDYLEHTAREARSQVETALAQLSGSQMQEKALQNEVDRLTARLDEVNTMRIDVLEANHELEEQMKQIAKCQKSLAIEVGLARCHIDQPAINTFQAKLKEAEERAVHLQQKLETVQEADEAPLSINVLAERVKELEKMLQEKGDLIREWGKEKKVCKPDVAVDQERGVNPSKDSGTPQFQDDAYAELVQENEALVAEISELKDKMVEKKKLLRRLEADRQKVAHLLYAELRRQAQCSNGEAEKSLRVSLSTKRKSDIDRMMADIQARARNATGANREPYELATEPARRVEQLEKEIEYHVKDIVLYRLDVKGYRKDIKCATATIERLQDALSGQVRAQLAASPRQIRARSSTAGLGLVPNTAQASPSTPISASPSPGHVSYTHRNASAASSYPNTPLATHKKLPCPPAPTTPPLSSSDTATPLSTPFNVKRHVSHASVCTPPSSDRPRRVGTQRSLSESIISSYARRTPERTPEFLKPSSAGGVVLEGRRGEKKKKGRKGMAGGCDPFAAASGGAPVPPPLWEVRVEGKEVDA